MKNFICSILAVAMLSSVCFAENWWDSSWFNYGVGIASIVVGVSMNSTADKSNQSGHDSITEAQTWADLSGYYEALGYTTSSTMYFNWSQDAKATADGHFASAANDLTPQNCTTCN